MPDAFIYVDEAKYDDPGFVADLISAVTPIICEQPGVPIPAENCWVKVLPFIGTEHITVTWLAHYKADDQGVVLDGRDEDWEYRVTDQLAPAIGAVAERHFPREHICVAVDGDRRPFGPKGSFCEVGKKA